MLRSNICFAIHTTKYKLFTSKHQRFTTTYQLCTSKYTCFISKYDRSASIMSYSSWKDRTMPTNYNILGFTYLILKNVKTSMKRSELSIVPFSFASAEKRIKIAVGETLGLHWWQHGPAVKALLVSKGHGRLLEWWALVQQDVEWRGFQVFTQG